MIDGGPVGDVLVGAEGMGKAGAVDSYKVVKPELKQHSSVVRRNKYSNMPIEKRTTLWKSTEILLNSCMNDSNIGSREWA